MKQRLTLVLAAIIYLCSSVYADRIIFAYDDNDDEEKPTIDVIGWWCKNDTMKYRCIESELKILNGNDTIKNDIKTMEEFMLIVRDSTSKGYTLEYIPTFTDIEYEGDENDKLDKQMMNSIKKTFGDVHAVFTTDECGAITGLKNWKEIRDKMYGAISMVLDTLYNNEPGLDSVMPRKQYESIFKLVYSTEQGVISAYGEMEMLFGLHGKMFDVGNTVVDENEKDSTVYYVFAGYGAYDDYGFDDDYNIGGKTVKKLSKDETADYVSNILGLLLTDSLSTQMNTLMKDSLDTGMIVTNLEDYYIFYNGWPNVMRTCSIVDYASTQIIKKKEVVWTYRSWREYDKDAMKPENTLF